jgi:hypothetical protein
MYCWILIIWLLEFFASMFMSKIDKYFLFWCQDYTGLKKMSWDMCYFLVTVFSKCLGEFGIISPSIVLLLWIFKAKKYGNWTEMPWVYLLHCFFLEPQVSSHELPLPFAGRSRAQVGLSSLGCLMPEAMGHSRSFIPVFPDTEWITNFCRLLGYAPCTYFLVWGRRWGFYKRLVYRVPRAQC